MTRPYEILIVDDEFELRNMLGAYLSRQGFIIRGAADSQEFDRLWRERPADLILLDINMPGEDGITLTRRLHRDKVRVGIILVTAADAPVRRKTLRTRARTSRG